MPDLKCDDVSRMISTGLDQSLTPSERTRLRLHFVICEACRNVNQQMQFLRQALRRADVPQDGPTPDDR